MTKANEDWTVDPATGRGNSSKIFEKLTVEVARLIRDSAHDLIAGNAGTVAQLIVAQLAHVHGMRPSEADMSLLRGLKPLIPQLAGAQNKITCLADIERLVAEDVKTTGKPGPRVVMIGTHIRQILQMLWGRGIFTGGNLDTASGQKILIRLREEEQYLSVERIPEEKEESTTLIHPSHKTGIEDHYPFGSAGHCTLVEGPKKHLCPDCATDLEIISRGELPGDTRIATSKKGEGEPKNIEQRVRHGYGRND